MIYLNDQSVATHVTINYADYVNKESCRNGFILLAMITIRFV